MVNKNYIAGRRFEYKVKHYLEDSGYIAIRSAGSHSPFDIIAIKGDKLLLLQLKHYKNGKMPAKELEKTYEQIRKLDIQPKLEATTVVIQDLEGLKNAIKYSNSPTKVKYYACNIKLSPKEYEKLDKKWKLNDGTEVKNNGM